MKHILPRAACAAALLFCSVSVDAIAGRASAQGSIQISFETFHDRLANYGDWAYSDRWGEVWIPADVPDDFRPYDTDGYWAYTDEYGWYWASSYAWGDIAFHYGRWVNDPDDGWLWIPGYVWSPAWVVWRSNDRYTGWMAMPPDDAFLGRTSIGVAAGGLGFSIAFNDSRGYYGYSRWYGRDYDRDRFAANWVFIPTGHMADRDYHRFAAPREQSVTFISSTTNITNYSVVNNYVVNRGVDVREVQRAGGRPVIAAHASDVIRNPQLVMRADEGRQIQMRLRAENPHGNGLANSAPAPSARIVQSLSTDMRVHPGNAAMGRQPPRHLFTRTTVESARFAPKPGTPGPGPSGAETGQGMNNNVGGTASNGFTRPGTESGMQGPEERHRHGNIGETTGTGVVNTGTSPGNVSPGENPEAMSGSLRSHRAMVAPGNISPGGNPEAMGGNDRHHRATPATGSVSPAENPEMMGGDERHHGTMAAPGEIPGGVTTEERRGRHEGNIGSAMGGGSANTTQVVMPPRHGANGPPQGDNSGPHEKRHQGSESGPQDNGAQDSGHDKKQHPQ